MKQYTLLLLLFTFAFYVTAQKELTTFDTIQNHLMQGYKLRFWINYEICYFDGSPPPGVNAWGGGELDTWTINNAEKHIQSNQGKLIFNYQSESGGYVWDLVSLNIYANTSVVLNAGDFSAPDPNQQIQYTEQVICTLSKGVKVFIQRPPKSTKPLNGYEDMMQVIGNGGLVRTVFPVSKNLVIGLPVSTFEAFHEADIGPNRTGFSTSYYTYDDKRYVDKSIIACHVYQAGYALIQYTVLDGTSLKSKMNNNYNITNGLLFEM